jgi:hypothetical protein
MFGLLWAQLEHHIATGYGVSDKTYASTFEKLLYGIEQGRCALPILWALLNQLCLTSLGDTFDCIILVSVNGEAGHVRPGDSGVRNDDTTMDPVPVEVTDLTQSEEDLIGQMQVIIQFFLDLLQVTGGDLAPEKCVWFFICHRCKHGKARLLTVQDSYRGIKIASRSTGTVSGVKRKAPEEGHRTLEFKYMATESILLKRKQ